jgi:molybdate transport system regulatory protein
VQVKNPRPDAEGRLASKIAVRARLWVEKNGETFLASGRVALLENILRYGSISKAARIMKMSYRHAWILIEKMNRLSGSPLVETFTGGSGGGGAILTEEGKRAIDLFHLLQKRLRSFARQQSRTKER